MEDMVLTEEIVDKIETGMIYCGGCAHLFYNTLNEKECICKCAQNVVAKHLVSENWRKRVVKTEYLRRPREINKNNNCEWHVPLAEKL